MPQPTPYVPQADYSVDYPGDMGNDLDDDHAAIQLTTDEIRTNIALLQRDDGLPRNGIIHPDSFTTAALALIGNWTPRGEWVTATVYDELDFVTESDIGYICLADHVAGTFATDLAAGRWMAISKIDSLTTAFALTLLDDTTASAMLTTLGVSAFVKTLLDDTTAGAFMTTLGLTSFVQTLLDDTTASAFRTTLGATATGDALFIAASAAAARTALDVPSNAEAILDTIIAAKGDLIVGTANDTPAILSVGVNGTFPIAQSAQSAGMIWGTDNTFTEDTTPDPAADYVGFYDVAAGAMRKSLIHRINAPTLATAIPATSTLHDFTGVIPPWAKRITAMLSQVSTNGTSAILMQLGTSGGIENTGYASLATTVDGVETVSTAGFVLNTASVAANNYSGVLTLTKMEDGTNLWLLSGMVRKSVTAYGHMCVGEKTLASALTQIRFTMVNGTDAFDAGSFNLMIE